MSAEAQIKIQVDRIAKGLENSLSAFATGDGFWTLVDAAADEAYENRVKGSILTELDTALSTNPLGKLSRFSDWFVYHNNYFTSDLGLTVNPKWTSYLATKGWRIPYSFQLMIESCLGSNLAAGNQFVFPKGTRPANEATPVGSLMHKFGSWTASGAAAGAWSTGPAKPRRPTSPSAPAATRPSCIAAARCSAPYRPIRSSRPWWTRCACCSAAATNSREPVASSQ